MTSPPPYHENQPYPTDYGGYPGHPGYPASRGTNGLAVASLVCAFVFAPLGAVFGHMSLSQIKKSGEEGRGLAIAGLIVSYLMIVVSIIIVVVSVLMVLLLAQSLEEFDNASNRQRTQPIPSAGSPLPPFDPPATLGSNCQYPATTERAGKPVQPPQAGRTSTTPASIPARIVTNRGDIGLELNNAQAPCTVHNFSSLAEQGFFDNTRCHRLTVDPGLRMLQCGDPTDTGTGGPGYRFPNEYPSNQYRLTDPALKSEVVYPRGTLAMANSGLGTNGSQFFLIFDDSMLAPQYTVFGTIDTKGLAALENIAAAGVRGGGEEGEPATDVTIKSVSVG
ncbi:peptidylprolyl isomerase [Mycobacterium sp. 236(2023)]|uniref:peptidylprolyl isomerase n=1 Tax=Mycobacterium sp. 236(2023) TaxID=3038163 RepID=UPI002414D20E|nr:peptidylprolyl isomerase [Mycobacterium sp. 236(2023)]MDG4669068.1 peptidylprolyl isomerase [Mycobacterium sp. 236(2023)]